MEGIDVYVVGKLLNTLCSFLSLHLEYSLVLQCPHIHTCSLSRKLASPFLIHSLEFG